MELTIRELRQLCIGSTGMPNYQQPAQAAAGKLRFHDQGSEWTAGRS